MLLLSLIFILCGCYSTHEIETYGQLSTARDFPFLTVMTLDTALYDLSRFSFDDSLLKGEGVRVVAGHSTPFSGNIPMSRIVRIRGQSINVAGSMLVIAVAALAAATAVHYVSGGGFSVYRKMGGDGLFVNSINPPGDHSVDPFP